MYERFGLFLDGAWRGASDGGTAPVLSPATARPRGDAPGATASATASW